MPTAHRYPALSAVRSIRTLCLDPADNDQAALHGSLEEVNLDEKPIYEALSYTWGAASPTGSISLNLENGDEAGLSLTPNCEAALRALRLKDLPRRLWIDAICIDQTSTEDKNSQVPMMRDVYSSASQVLVWLGNGQEDKGQTQQIMRLIRLIGKLTMRGWLRISARTMVETRGYTTPKAPEDGMLALCEAVVSRRIASIGSKVPL
jgi:hypothetical protein